MNEIAQFNRLSIPVMKRAIKYQPITHVLVNAQPLGPTSTAPQEFIDAIYPWVIEEIEDLPLILLQMEPSSNLTFKSSISDNKFDIFLENLCVVMYHKNPYQVTDRIVSTYEDPNLLDLIVRELARVL